MMIQYKKENITVFQSAIYMTTTAIIEGDEAIVMTDPCLLPNEVEEIRTYIDTIKNDRQLYIIYTHHDFDHIIGSGAFPDAQVIASHPFAYFSQKEKIVNEMINFDNQYYLQRKYEHHYPDVNIVLSKDGEILQLGSLKLTFYLAPGHTTDSIFTIVEPNGIFLAGDYLSNVEFPFIDSSYHDYIKTMEKVKKIMETHKIRTLIPGHGQTTDCRKEMNGRIHFAYEYLNGLLTDKDDTYLEEKFIFFPSLKSIHERNKKIARMEQGLINK